MDMIFNPITGQMDFGIRNNVQVGGNGQDGSYRATSAGGTRIMEMGATDSGNYLYFGAFSNHDFGITRNGVKQYSINVNSFEPQIHNTNDLGASGRCWDDVYATNGVIQTSDREQKESIAECSLGMDFIAALNPVGFQWKDQEVPAGVAVNTREVVEPAYTKTHQRTHHGLIAQDVEDVLESMGMDTNDFAGFIHDEKSGRRGLRYQEFLAPLIKAVQELSARVAELEGEA